MSNTAGLDLENSGCHDGARASFQGAVGLENV